MPAAHQDARFHMTDPLTAIIAAIPSLAKAGADIASTSDEKQRNAQLIEFQRVVIQLQTNLASIQIQNASLLRDKNNLEQQIMQLKNWDAESQKYELREISAGIFARVQQHSPATPLKSAHKFCAKCFEEQQKSILQFQAVEVGRKRSLVCQRCKSVVEFRTYVDET